MRNSNLNAQTLCGNQPVSWPGHLEITSKSLLSIMERATGGAADISVAERCLFMACEFWAATKANTLALHLGASASDTLPTIGTIFAAIGAGGVASDLDAAFVDLAASPGAASRLQCINALQNRLLTTDEPVDKLLARFAVELLGNAHARLRRSGTAADS
jgi:hypothetical protein